VVASTAGAAYHAWHYPGIVATMKRLRLWPRLPPEENLGATADCRILPITAAHIDSYRAAMDTVARERRHLSFLQAPSSEQTRAFVMNNIAMRHPHFIAQVGREVVGWCDIVPLGQQGFTHTGVLGMGVRPDWRGRGIGKALLTAAISAAAALDLSRIELEVYAANTVARTLYQSCGFVEEGVKRKGRYLDGRHEDIVIMARLLG
jgi:RimJ/RimL family protein N-acetyltransferase